jgi:plastocyanin
MRTFLLPALAAAAVFAAGCGGSGESSAPVPTTEVQMVKSYRFDPKVIEIKAGETVTWTNEDKLHPYGRGRRSGGPQGTSPSMSWLCSVQT